MAIETIDISKYAVTTAHSIKDLKSNISELKKALDTLPIGTKKYADALAPAEQIISQLSFSHIREIMTVNDSLARFFYETECIRRRP